MINTLTENYSMQWWISCSTLCSIILNPNSLWSHTYRTCYI